MIVPTRRALAWLAAGGVVCLLAALDHRWLVLAVLLDLAVLLLVWLQGRRLRGLEVGVQRRWVGQPQVDRPCTFELVIENNSVRTVEIHARQAWPSVFQAEEDRWSTHLNPRERVAYTVAVTPRARGRWTLPDMELDVLGVMSLGGSRRVESADAGVTVFPNLDGVRAYEKLRRSRAFRAAGFHRQRVIGLGREFDQMREYVPGDDYRDINWKATARTGDPHTNLYQVERSRDIILCVDGGRMMGNPLGRRTTLDHAVDAAMLMIHAGQDQGDRVGLVTFRDRVETFIKPGTSNGSAMLNALAHFDSRPVFPSYLQLVEALRSRQTHRSLVFILTDLNDPQLTQDLAELMPILVARHVVVVVSLQDASIERVASGSVGGKQGGVARVLAARSMAQERRERTAELIKAGVHVLEADAANLSLAVMNHYMSVKSRQLI